MSDELIPVWLSEDEWYPVYNVRRVDPNEPSGGDVVCIAPDLFERFTKARAEFAAVNDEMNEIWKEVFYEPEMKRRQEEYGAREFKRTISENPELPLTKSSHDA